VKPSLFVRRIFSWLITLSIPYVLILSAIRLILLPAFLPLEYSTPGFPDDPYGFTLQDRLKWSTYTWNYLTNDAGISYLADLRFPDGTPVFNQRELSHMVDVKKLIQTNIRIWLGTLAALLVLGVWSWRGKWLDDFRRGVWRGGWLAVLLIIAILIFTVTSFNSLFTDFHHIFFVGNSWIFSYSDTLIRMFPLRFFQDIFIYIGALTLAAGLILGLSLGRRVPAAESNPVYK
jgi:integral membrane protein (TIGR01906 family)